MNRFEGMKSGRPTGVPLRQAPARSQPTTRPDRRALLAYRSIERAWYGGAGAFPCWTSPSPTFEARQAVHPEIFTAMIIFEQLDDSALSVSVRQEILELLHRKRSNEGLHRFFFDEERLPADADCTGIAHALLLESGAVSRSEARATAARILKNVSAEGVIAVYFTEEPKRTGLVDPVVCANALSLLTRLGLHEQARATTDFLLRVIEGRLYEEGTRYYPTAEAFLYFAARLIGKHPEIFPQHLRLLQRQIAARGGQEAGPLDLAFRALAAEQVGVPNDEDRALIEAAQGPDGTWRADAFFRYGRSNLYFGSEALTTAFCLRALRWTSAPSFAAAG